MQVHGSLCTFPVAMDCTEAVRLWLEANADRNKPRFHDVTPLSIASEEGHCIGPPLAGERLPSGLLNKATRKRPDLMTLLRCPMDSRVP